MLLAEVKTCPDTFSKWKLNSKRCSNTEHYHCLLDENSKFVEGCIKPIWIEPGFCPLYNTLASKMDSRKCKDAKCPSSTFRSFQIYQYPECLSSGIASLDTTSVGNTYSYTTYTSTTTGSSSSPVSIILPSVLVPFVLLSIAIAVLYIKCKKINRKENYSNIWNCCQTNSQKEKPADIRVRNCLSNCLPSNTEETSIDNEDFKHETSTLLNMEDGSSYDTSVQMDDKKLKIEAFLNSMNATTCDLYEDDGIMSKFLETIRKVHTVAIIGERGSGKKTLAMQLALKLEAGQNELQYKVLHDFRSFQYTIPSAPTIIIIPELYKTWLTDTHVKNIIKWLALLRSLPKQQRCYVIATFIKTTWSSFTEIGFENFNDAFPVEYEINELGLAPRIATYILEKQEMFNNEFSRRLKKSTSSNIGKPLQALFYCKFPFCRGEKFVSNPLAAIMLELKDMHVRRSFDYRVLVYIMLHNGCIEKERLLKDTKHSLFDDILRNVEDKQCFFQGRVNNLLTTYLVNSIDGKCYRIIHDVIVRCLFIVAFKSEYFDLLCRECDPEFLLDCIREKTAYEKLFHKGEFIVDFGALKIGFPSEKFSKIAEVFNERETVL